MVHYWPADDGFVDGYVPSHRSWDYYFHLYPWNTDQSYALGGTGFGLNFNEWNQFCGLFSGWFGQTFPPQPGASANPAAMAHLSGSGATSSFLPGGFVWRSKSLIDCSVEMSWQVQSSTGSVPGGSAMIVGVGARLSGGSFQSQGINEQHVIPTSLDVNGYWFIVSTQRNTPFGFKFMLVSINNSATTRLIDSPTTSTGFNAFATGDFLSTHRLRMSVENEGPDVRIKCYSTLDADIAGSGETLIFNFLDNTATKITTTGCVGMILTNERKPTGSFIFATCVNWWQIASPDSATTVYLRDEWERVNPQGGYFTSDAWLPGYTLHTGWYGDNYSNPGAWPQATGQVLFHDRPEHALDRLSVCPGNLGSPTASYSIDGVLISQRPADSTGSQDRTITGNYSSAGTVGYKLNQNGFGIALRCSPVAPSSLPNCYYCVHSVDYTALTAKIELFRSSFDGVNKIAELTGLPYVLDTDIFLRMTIASVDPDNIARIRLRIAGALLVLVAPAVPVSGVTIAGDGTVDDASAQRVVTGPGEGLYIRHLLTLTASNQRPFYLDTWFQGAGETYDPIDPPPPPPPPVDLTPIAVSTEIDGWFGLLDLGRGGQWEVEQDPSDQGLVHRYENDCAQSFATAGKVRRSWTIKNNAVNTAADAALLVFFDAHGCQYPFQWVTDEGDTAYVVFTTPDLEQRIRDAGVFGYAISLQERFP